MRFSGAYYFAGLLTCFLKRKVQIQKELIFVSDQR